jgi:hypothetical protein
LSKSRKKSPLELSAIELGGEVARDFHASLGLGDLGFQPLFHDPSPSVNLQIGIWADRMDTP